MSIGLLSLAIPSLASARCIGSDDPLVIEAENEVGRDPAAAIAWIDRAIERTDSADRRRIANLYLAQSIAYSMAGQPGTSAIDAANRIAAPLPEGDPIKLFLAISRAAKIDNGTARSRRLDAIAEAHATLPASSGQKTCLGVDLAYYKSMDDEWREAFEFASQAYRDRDAERNSRPRAEAASLLAYILSEGHQYEYAKQLHSEALSYFVAKDLYDLAANEYVIRGFIELEMGQWLAALADFEASIEQARSYGNDFAVAYAELGACQAALDGNMIKRAQPSCDLAFAALNGPREPMAITASTAKASLLLRQDRPAEAVSVLNKAIAERAERANAKQQAAAHEVRAEALYALGRYAEAYQDTVRAGEINEDLYERRQSNATVIAQARFQTQELQTDLEKEQLSGQASRRLALAVVIGAVTILLLLGLLVFTLLQHRREFRKLAMIDPLTNLSNRRATLDQADEALRDAGTTKPRAAVALLDIDHFKRCNDTYGHDAGDEVLREFAHIVNAEMRDQDIVGRWGGEEFLVIFPRTRAAEAAAAIERIRNAALRAKFDFAPGYVLQFSAGIGELDEAEGDLREIIKLADRRLYAAKAKGRNRTTIKGAGIDVLAAFGKRGPANRPTP
ncbi:diguanylate cyclase [Qipengyuania flava]|nr:diguanylate cyclase [Qipengyuania flava]